MEWLGKKHDPKMALRGKVLLMRFPENRGQGLLEIKKIFHMQISAAWLWHVTLPYVVADEIYQAEALELIKGTGCPACLQFVCDTQEIDGKGYFSYLEVLTRYEGQEPCIQRSHFKNTLPFQIPDEVTAIKRAKKECTIEYTDTAVYRDEAGDMWMVLFYCQHVLGGCQEVYMGSDGITCLIVYGE